MRQRARRPLGHQTRHSRQSPSRAPSALQARPSRPARRLRRLHYRWLARARVAPRKSTEHRAGKRRAAPHLRSRHRRGQDRAPALPQRRRRTVRPRSGRQLDHQVVATHQHGRAPPAWCRWAPRRWPAGDWPRQIPDRAQAEAISSLRDHHRAAQWKVAADETQHPPRRVAANPCRGWRRLAAAAAPPQCRHPAPAAPRRHRARPKIARSAVPACALWPVMPAPIPAARHQGWWRMIEPYASKPRWANAPLGEEQRSCRTAKIVPNTRCRAAPSRVPAGSCGMAAPSPAHALLSAPRPRRRAR